MFIGQPSETVCGKGYSCYFSGFNYQCCPTNDEDNEDNHNHQYESEQENDNEQIENAECPDATFMVLNLNGNPIKCNPSSNKCPEVSN